MSEAHFKVMPWKNGGGQTTELLKIPEESENFDLRLSVAQINSDGPFSIFKHIDRWIVLLSGEGVVLQFDERTVELNQASAPYYFMGEERVECRLLGESVSDFNLMMRRGYGIAEMMKCQTNQLIRYSDSDHFFIYEIENKRLIELQQGESWDTQNKLVIVIKLNKTP